MLDLEPVFVPVFEPVVVFVPDDDEPELTVWPWLLTTATEAKFVVTPNAALNASA